MNSTKTTLVKDTVWHCIKALLCVVQLYLLHGVAMVGISSLLRQLLEEWTLSYALLLLGVDIALFFALWWYYDSIDDHSFDRYCEQYRDCEEPPHLLRAPGFIAEAVVTLLGATPVLASAVSSALSFAPLHPAAISAISLGGAAVFVAAAVLLRIHSLSETWTVQRDLRRQQAKPPSAIKHAIKRVVYAVIYFAALYLAVYSGIAVFIPAFGSVVVAMFLLLKIPLLILLVFLAVLEVLRFLRRILDRRKFLRRLERLRDKGELSFTIHGRPYLSLFGYRNGFGLTVTDVPHPDGPKKDETTYCVAVANCHRRRLTVILCENHIYQFMYSVNIRVMRSMRGGMGMMGAAGVTTNRSFSLPAAAWFSSHGFTFPAGEGEKVLLVDPTPHVLCLRGGNGSEMYPLDNGSKVFGYTVYGKNSFVNMLERT